MVSHRSHSFFPLLFHSFTRHHVPLHSSLPSVFFTVVPPVLLNRPIVYAINLSFHFINFSSVLPWCYSISPYPSIISVCLTLTQMHLPQSLPLHRINGFARFFHGFISVLLLHNDIVVTHRNRNFSIAFPLFHACFRR